MNAGKHGGRVCTQVMDERIKFIKREDIIDFMYTHTLETYTHTARCVSVIECDLSIVSVTFPWRWAVLS